MIKKVIKAFNFFNLLFKRKKKFSLGLYGPPNAGKSTLANRIAKDILGTKEDIFKTSNIEHETREVNEIEDLVLTKKGKKLIFNLSDTPGIATKVDFEDFVKKGIKKKDAIERAKEATQGVIDSIKWLDKVDCVIVVLDSTKNPYNQVNITLMGNLSARKKKYIIAANKIDLKKSNVDKIKLVFPDAKVVPISAEKGLGLDNLYKAIFEEFA